MPDLNLPILITHLLDKILNIMEKLHANHFCIVTWLESTT